MKAKVEPFNPIQGWRYESSNAFIRLIVCVSTRGLQSMSLKNEEIQSSMIDTIRRYKSEREFDDFEDDSCSLLKGMFFSAFSSIKSSWKLVFIVWKLGAI